jgi:hypothetical protein
MAIGTLYPIALWGLSSLSCLRQSSSFSQASDSHRNQCAFKHSVRNLELKWGRHGPWILQHDPDFTDEGRIVELNDMGDLVFEYDNIVSDGLAGRTFNAAWVPEDFLSTIAACAK